MKFPYLIHYGTDKFLEEAFVPITNREYFNKPLGGFWTSPVDSEHSWFSYVMDSGMEWPLDQCIFLKAKEESKVLIINSMSDIKDLPTINDELSSKKLIDYEALVNHYDAIWLTAEGEANTRYTNTDMNLYGWDCETFLFLNSHSIQLLNDRKS